MDPQSSHIETIDLDCDESEKISNGKGIQTGDKIKKSQPFVSTNATISPCSPQVGKCIDLPQSDSTVVTKTTQKISSKSSLDKINIKSTLAIIPVDCLKYCDVKDGKYQVTINTLHKLNEQQSQVYLYDIPKGNNGELPNKGDPAQSVYNISSAGNLKLQSSIKVGNLNKKGQANNGKLKNDPQAQRKVLYRPIAPKNITLNESTPAASSTKPSTDKHLVLSLNTKHSLVSQTKKVKNFKKFKFTPQSKYPSILERQLLAHQSTPQNSKRKYMATSGSSPQSIDYKPKIKKFKIMKNIPQIPTEVSPSIDLTEDDPLEVPEYTGYENSFNPPPLAPISSAINMDNFLNITGTSRFSNISHESEQTIQNSYEYETRVDYECHENSGDVGQRSNQSDPLDYSDFLNDIQNIFEPIITLNEQVDLDSTESDSTEHIRVKGIPPDKLQELHMIQNDKFNRPFRALIPNDCLKYCYYKNGRCTIDMRVLNNITKAKNQSISETSCMIPKDDIKKPNIKMTKNIKQKFRNFNTLKDTKNKNKIMPGKYFLLPNEKQGHLGKGKRIKKPSYRMIQDKPSFPDYSNKKSTPATQKPSKRVHLQPTLPDKCRYLFLKSSAWDKFDPEKFKGFNEREQYISYSCSKNFTKNLNSVKNDWSKLQNNIFTPNKPTNKWIDFASDDLYITKKIEIFDQGGNILRTEHITPTKRPTFRSDIEFMLTKVKPCKIVLQKNKIVEDKIKQMNPKHRLNAKILQCWMGLQGNRTKPVVILGQHNLFDVKLSEEFCVKHNVIFIKKPEDDFPPYICQNKLFLKLVEKNLIKITSPKVLECYFSIEKVFKFY